MSEENKTARAAVYIEVRLSANLQEVILVPERRARELLKDLQDTFETIDKESTNKTPIKVADATS